MANNPWMMDPKAGGGAAGISGPGGVNPAAKKKKPAPAVKGGGGGAPKTGPGAVYHGWKVPEGVPNKTGKDWGTWGPLTAGAGGTGGYGGSAWNFLHNLPSEQKGSVFGWLGKNYNPAQGQGGNIGAAQALLKSGDYAGFLKMVGAGGGGGNPWAAGGGGGGVAPRTSPLYADPMGGGGNAPLTSPVWGMGGGGGANAPLNGPLTHDVLPEFPQDTSSNYLQQLLRQMQGQSGPSYSRW